MKASGRSRRVMSRSSQARSARASTCAALYQCRLFAFTLPTTTLFWSTMVAAKSALKPVVRPPLPTPVRQTTAPADTTPEAVANDLANACALDDDIRVEADILSSSGVVLRAQGTHELGLGARDGVVQHVHVQAVLRADQRREQADGSGAGDENVAWFPEGPLPNCLHLLSSLGDHRSGLEQHAENTERAVHLHGVLRLHPPLFGHEAVYLFNAALGVLATAAHVPFAHGAVGTWHRVGTAYNTDDQVAFLQAAGRARVEYPTERFWIVA